MSHQDEPAICPNCGYNAEDNYCAQCGQKNHLHKDTTWSLVVHFLEHYLHYDNKFWQTIKALLFKPGKLTIAYWNNQRQRYISPVSLYIFISAINFLASHFVFSMHEKDIYASLRSNKFIVEADSLKEHKAVKTTTSGLESVAIKIKKNPEILKPYIDNIEQNTPKVFFFLIPLTALLLKLFFIKRKEIYFADHVIFSLHWHSFYFMVGFVYLLFAAIPQLRLVTLTSFILFIIYFVAAIKNAYQVKTSRAIGCTVFVAVLYSVVYYSIVGYYLSIVYKILLAQ